MTSPLADDGDMLVHRIVAGAAKPVLVADFQAFSSAPRLSHLVIDRAGGRPVYQVDPLEALSRDRPYISLADLAAEAVDSFGRFQPADGPAFVIGYCSAAALSMHIATLLARSREATAVHTGVADVVVCYRAFNERSGNRFGQGVQNRPPVSTAYDRWV